MVGVNRHRTNESGTGEGDESPLGTDYRELETQQAGALVAFKAGLSAVKVAERLSRVRAVATRSATRVRRIR